MKKYIGQQESNKEYLYFSLLFFIVIIYIMSFSNVSMCMENEPSQLRGIGWGDNIKMHPDLIRSRVDELGRTIINTDSGYRIYIRKNEIKQIGKATVDEIFYMFCDDKFCYARINFGNFSSYNELYNILRKTHGKPALTDDQGFTRWKEWHGNKIKIVLSYAEIHFNKQILERVGFVDYTYLSLWDSFHDKKAIEERKKENL